MTKGTKIGLIIGVVLVVGVGGYFIYQRLKKDSSGEGEGEGEGEGNENNGGNTNTISNDINAPVNNVVEDNTPSTPFQNSSQGDIFRWWVNTYHPKYAGEINLDIKGKYNNSVIKKAYQKFGKEFLKKQPDIFQLKSRIPESFYSKVMNPNYSWKQENDKVYLQPKNTYVTFKNDGYWFRTHEYKISGKWWNSGKSASCSKDKCGSVANVKGGNFLELAQKIDKTYKPKSSFDGDYGL